MPLKLKPLLNRVLILRLVEAEKQEGGIVIPDTAKSKSVQGTVQAIGPEVKSLKKGDVVLLPKFGGAEITHGKEEYVLLKEEDVMGVFG